MLIVNSEEDNMENIEAQEEGSLSSETKGEQPQAGEELAEGQSEESESREAKSRKKKESESSEEHEAEAEEDDDKPIEVNDTGIYAIRTTANKEKNVASKIYDRAIRDGSNISAIIVPSLKGYLLIEGSRKDIDKAYRGVAHARGLVAGKTELSEISHFLAPKPAVTTLAVDYIVEVTAGPFKGEKAKITRVDNTKNEITIELLEATVPIPITVPAESVRVIEKEPEGKSGKKKGAGTGKYDEDDRSADPFTL